MRNYVNIIIALIVAVAMVGNFPKIVFQMCIWKVDNILINIIFSGGLKDT